MEETSMNQIKSIKLYLKLISIEHIGMNQVARHFEDLEYLNTINIQYSEILSNVTTRGYSHPCFSEVSDVRLGRSIFYHVKSFRLYFVLPKSIIHLFSHKAHNN